MKKIKKYLIKEEALESFDVIGICTSQSDFRLAWQLNSKFDIKLQKSGRTLEIPNKKSDIQNKWAELDNIVNLQIRYFGGN